MSMGSSVGEPSLDGADEVEVQGEVMLEVSEVMDEVTVQVKDVNVELSVMVSWESELIVENTLSRALSLALDLSERADNRRDFGTGGLAGRGGLGLI